MRLRALALGVAIPLAITAQAQLFDGPIRLGLKTLAERGLISLPEQANPMQPTGFPQPPVKREGDLPKQGPLGPDGGAFTLIDSGHVSGNKNLIHITEGVEFTDRGYHCWADELYGDKNTDTYTLKGHVRVEGADKSIYGDLVQVDFKQRTFVAEEAESTLKPEFVQGRIRGNVYVKAHRSYGSEREVFGEKTSTTTCSYPDPHYEIVAERTDVRPNRRVIFRKVKLKILGHTILNLPYLSIPLDERTYNNLPIVGHGQLEGYFIKSHYDFPGAGDTTFRTRLDYFTRLGAGFGAGIKYRTRQAAGSLNVYTIQGPHKELEIIGQHRQDFGWATLALDSTYENDNYLISSTSKILNTRATLSIPRGKSSDRIGFLVTKNDSPGATSIQQTIQVSDISNWSSRFRTNLDLNLSANSSSFTGGKPVRREQLDVKFQAVDDLQKAQARLDYIRSIPIGESSNFFTASDITPSLTFLSDSRRLFGSGFDAKFPFQTQIGFGQFTSPQPGNPPRSSQVSRADFDFLFQNPRSTGTKRFTLNYQGEFKQDVYSDDTAQYMLRTSTQASYNFGRDSRFNISYNYLRPEGFTPLQIDRRGNINNLVSDLSMSPFRNMQIGVQTGYDFNLIKQNAPTPWQQVGLLAKYTLGNYFQARALSTYDTTRHAYSTTRFDLTWIPGATYVSFGAKYDGIRNKWAAANLFVDGFKVGRLRTSVLLNYNGYTKHFDAQHYSFIYDLHCAEAVLQIIENPPGFNSGPQVFFFIRLKALPFDTPFGTGQRGQPIGTGTGRDF